MKAQMKTASVKNVRISRRRLARGAAGTCIATGLVSRQFRTDDANCKVIIVRGFGE
jgi:hypothetical protein